MDEPSVPSLPGFRFHPTEEELLNFYLKNMIFRNDFSFDIIGVLNIYRHDPWDLPGLSKIGEREWYFFVPRDRRQSNGGRPNRTTEHGFWKATGSDRKIVSLSNPKRVLGLRKTLVFYQGRAPRGSKTDWVMNEYRLPDNCSVPKDIVLCKIYRKATSLKVLEKWAAKEEEIKSFSRAEGRALPIPATSSSYYSTSPLSSSNGTAASPYSQIEDLSPPLMPADHMGTVAPKKEDPELNFSDFVEDDKLGFGITATNTTSNSIELPSDKFSSNSLPELQVPKLGMDCTQDSFWTQLMRSPLLDNIFTPNYASCNLLNF